MPEPWFIGAIDARVRLRQQVDNEARSWNADVPAPSDDQIAMVLHALADHTAIMQALVYRPPEDGMWPGASSVGRWLQDYGDYMSRRGQFHA